MQNTNSWFVQDFLSHFRRVFRAFRYDHDTMPTMSSQNRYYAIVIPGLESLAAQELTKLSAHDIHIDEGGVGFSGSWETLYRVNLRSRLITRVLLRLAKFSSMNIQSLAWHVSSIDWSQYLHATDDVHVAVTAHQSKLMHTGMIAEHVKKAVSDSLSKTKSDSAITSRQGIYVRIQQNHCTVALDTSGARLDQRGYRQKTVQAPVRETIASGVLQWMKWQAHQPLYVPMCGSGTIAIEAACMAAKQAPSLEHDFPFKLWPVFYLKRWKKVLGRAEKMLQLPVHSKILASDISDTAVAACKHNMQQAGMDALIDVYRQDLFDTSKKTIQRLDIIDKDADTAGLMICNPPYGLRLRSDKESVYRKLGKLVRNHFSAWEVAVFVPDQVCMKAMGLSPKKRLRLRHGGRWLEVLHVSGN